MTLSPRAVFDGQSSLALPYADLEDCVSRLQGIEAIDYFYAQYLISLCQHTHPFAALSSQQVAFTFHVLLALNYSQRQGNSCLMLDSLADARWWSQSDSTNVVSAEYESGYQFPDSAALAQIIPLWENIFAELEGVKCLQSRLYTEKFYHYEHAFCEHLLKKMAASDAFYESINSEVLDDTLASLKTSLSNDWPLLFAAQSHADTTDWQQVAVMHALVSQFAIISGGAGTGKTYTVSRLLMMLTRGLGISPRRIGLIAPTGKAANRLATSLQQELARLTNLPEFSNSATVYSQISVQTVHRLLGIHPIDGRCKYDGHRLLPFDCIILDEASMVDLSLMHKLMRATGSHCKLIMVGDPNQLPSVEAGCLLADLVAIAQPRLSSHRIAQLGMLNPHLRIEPLEFHTSTHCKNQYLVSLQQVKRSEQGVVRLADWVLKGEADKVFDLSDANTQWQSVVIAVDHAHGLEQVLVRSVLPELAKIFTATNLLDAWRSLMDYACLIPNRRGYGGVEWVNGFVENKLSRQYPWIEAGELYQGKPIMIVQNDYNLGLFNGDVGIIWPDETGELWAYFPSGHSEQFQAFSLYTLPAFDAVYAMTIHKTQGSEYQHVDIILPHHTAKYLTRELLYTGVTRAKKQVRIFTDQPTLQAAITQKVQRVSGIDAMLANII